MNPWDVKLTYELTERELLDYVGFLEARGGIEIRREQDIKRLVAAAVAHWQESLALPQWQRPVPFQQMITTGRTTLGFYGDNDTVTPSFHNIVVKLPQWMPREYVEYLAEMQVREQWPEND